MRGMVKGVRSGLCIDRSGLMKGIRKMQSLDLNEHLSLSTRASPFHPS